jgi:hypothetical protein
VPAVLGTLYFLFRLIMMIAGIGGGGDFGDAGHVDGGHGDSSQALKVLSIHSFAAFLMGFGWGGLAAHHGYEVPWGQSLLWGLGAGAVMVWIEAMALKAIHDLQSSGNLPLEQAMGAEGSVYVRVPPAGQGRGQVRLVIQGREKIATAVSEGGELERSTRVRVIKVNDDNTVSVVASV